MRKYFLFASMLFLSACASAPTPQATQAAVILPDTPEPSLPLVQPTREAAPTQADTPLPSETLAPTFTLTATYTDTPAPTTTETGTSTPTPFAGFAAARVYTAIDYADETIFYFIVPLVNAPYYGTVDGHPMTCAIDINYPNTLTCRADLSLFGTDVKAFEFYADEALSFLVYRGDFSTGLDVRPPTPTPVGFIWPRADFDQDDITWAPASTWCPERGQDLYCETEYRNYDGVCLVGSTCYDACGYYYSVDTIGQRDDPWENSGPCW